MAYGTLKADSLVYDDGGSDSTPVTISSLGSKVDSDAPDFTTNIELKAAAPVIFNQTDNTAAVSLKAPGTGVTSYTITLPATVGASGKVLKTTDGAGALEWGDDSATDATKLPLAGGTMTGAITFDASQTFDGVDVSTLPTLATAQTWTGSQRGPTHGIGTVSSGDAVIPLDSGNHFTLTVGGSCKIKFMKNTTPDAITSSEVGQTGTILVTNSGSHVPTWETTTYFAGGLSSAPTITASADTLLTYTVIATNKIVVAGLSAIGNA